MSAAAACAGLARGGGCGTRDRGSGRVVPGRTLPAAGSCRFGRPLNASVLAPGPQNGPERRAGLGWNERNFLSLDFIQGYFFSRPMAADGAIEFLEAQALFE